MKTEHLTAYALGELHGPDRQLFEKKLQESPSLASELSSTSEFCNLMKSSLSSNPEKNLPESHDASFTEEQRASLLSACRKNIAASRKNRILRFVAFASAATAIAACLAFSLAIPSLTPSAPNSPSLAQNTTPLFEKTDKAPSSEVLPAQPVNTPATPIPASAIAENALPSLSPPLPSSEAESGAILAMEVGKERAGATPKLRKKQEEASLSEAVACFAIAPTEIATGAGAKPEAKRALARPASVCSDAAAIEPAKFDREAYDPIQSNRVLDARSNPLSTFSADVDTAAYSNVRRFLQADQTPPPGAIRIEEMLNYFSYDYPAPEGDAPFSVTVETAVAPWDPQTELARIALRARPLDPENRPPSNLVFLVDVSGSMSGENKLPLLAKCLRALTENLSKNDKVSIVTYAGSSGVLLPPTPGSEKGKILAALDSLNAGGSTNGAGGILAAYQLAKENYIPAGSNRVILCTDGDFNVGTTDQSSLVALIEKERQSNVFLSVLGFGTGNLNDSMMEKLSGKGNGNYAYIDSLSEGRKVLVEQMGGTLFTVAKDVKIQIEFNPAQVSSYRLLGYENRILAKEDFNDDKKDAGEIGAGHTVTALYEITRTKNEKNAPAEPLKYQSPAPISNSSDLFTLKLRYKSPEDNAGKLIEKTQQSSLPQAFSNASEDFQFASAVAAFGMKLRGEKETQNLSWKEIQSIARKNLKNDPGSLRAEFLTLVEKASQLPSPKNND